MAVYPDYASFIAQHPTGQAGDSFLVGTDMYIWDASSGWRDLGDISGVQGDQGAVGATGAQGSVGVPGTNGTPGGVGPVGQAGPTGATGPPSPFIRISNDGNATGSNVIAIHFDPGVWDFSIRGLDCRFTNVSGGTRYFDLVRTNVHSNNDFVHQRENNKQLNNGATYSTQTLTTEQLTGKHWVELLFRDVTADRLWYIRYWTSEKEVETVMYADRIY
jgi:hypothetical protein